MSLPGTSPPGTSFLGTSSTSSMRVLAWHRGAAPRGRAGACPSQGAVAAMSLPGTSPPGTSFLGTSSTSSMDGLAGNAADELVLDEMVSSLSLLREGNHTKPLRPEAQQPHTRSNQEVTHSPRLRRQSADGGNTGQTDVSKT